MRKRDIALIFGMFLVVIGAALAASTYYRAVISPSGDDAELAPIVPFENRHLSAEGIIPVHIAIPSIEVDAEIVPVGIAKTGRMAVPEGYSKVGWYELGYQPGDTGHAVLAGHLDNGFGMDAVFKRVGELKEGDTIELVDASGKKMVFTVYRKASYDFDETKLDEVFGPAPGAEISIITCDGTWMADKKSYDKRTVVFARLAPPEEAS